MPNKDPEIARQLKHEWYVKNRAFPYKTGKALRTRLGAKVGTGRCVHTVFVSYGAVAAMLIFQMASDRAKWNIYVHSRISGTQGVNAP